MDNDTLVNQARNLYAILEVRQHTRGIEQFDRFDYLVMCAYCRYQRRLNRCDKHGNTLMSSLRKSIISVFILKDYAKIRGLVLYCKSNNYS
jgi:hypothetical protein